MPDAPPPPSARTTVRRGAPRAVYDPGEVHAVIDAAPICHVATVTENGPLALPMAHGRIGDHVYLHGAPANALLNASTGSGICATFTLLDALVVARSAFHNSMNYRCAVVMGVPQPLDGSEKVAALRAVTDHVIPNFSTRRPPTNAELHRTLVLSLSLREASVKIRTGDPVDEPADVPGPWWAGTVPLEASWGAPVAAANLPPGVVPPESFGAPGQP